MTTLYKICAKGDTESARQARGAFSPDGSYSRRQMATKRSDVDQQLHVVTAAGQHAGLVLSPSKKSKLSPDSVVLITPLPNAMSNQLDGLSGDEVCVWLPFLRLSLRAAHSRTLVLRIFCRSSSPTATATPTRTTSSCQATSTSTPRTSTCARSPPSGLHSTRR